MNLIIDPTLKATIPPLDPSELEKLEASIVAEGCRDSIVIWNGTIVDGHNRYEICTRLGLSFQTVGKEFESIHHARIWMRENQGARRNASKGWLVDCALENKEDLLAIGRAKNAETGGRPPKEPVLQNNTSIDEPRHSTRAEIAKAAGVSPGTVAKAEQVKKKDPALWEKVKADEVSISAAYKEVSKPDDDEAPTVDDARGSTSPTQSSRRPPIKIIESEGMRIWLLAKSHLDRINKNDEFREDALRACIDYCEGRISAKK
jgi:ParB-like chromosome segregation protein Spo0J